MTEPNAASITSNSTLVRQEQAQSMARRRRNRRTVLGRISTHATLIVVSAVVMIPIGWMLLTSVKSLSDTMAFPPTFIPRPFQWRNYLDVVFSPKARFLLWTHNTLVISVLVVAGTTLSSAAVAYGFAKIRFRGRGVLFAVMVSTMMVPFPVTMVSLFSMFHWLGDATGQLWIGTFKPLWVPAWFGSAFNVFLLRQFFTTIPDELSEAARIDGCSEVGIFFRIILPLAKPALAVVALFAFMGTWNDFLGPLIYLQRPDQFTLALGLQDFQSQQGGTPWHELMAASVLVIMPVLVLFFLAHRTFVEGIATSGLK